MPSGIYDHWRIRGKPNAKLSASLMGNKRALGKNMGTDNPAKRPEVRLKIHLAQLGNHRNRGVAKSESTRQKMSVSAIDYYQSHPEECQRLREQRMNQVLPQKDTLIEVAMQNALRDRGIQFETHRNYLGKCQADVSIGNQILIFVDGDFYHGCHICFEESKLPEWVRERRLHDKLITENLRHAGYTVLRFWEHEIKHNVVGCVDQIANRLVNIQSESLKNCDGIESVKRQEASSQIEV